MNISDIGSWWLLWCWLLGLLLGLLWLSILGLLSELGLGKLGLCVLWLILGKTGLCVLWSILLGILWNNSWSNQWLLDILDWLLDVLDWCLLDVLDWLLNNLWNNRLLYNLLDYWLLDDLLDNLLLGLVDNLSLNWIVFNSFLISVNGYVFFKKKILEIKNYLWIFLKRLMVHIQSSIRQHNNLSPFSLLVHIKRPLILHIQQQISSMGHTQFWILLWLSNLKKYSKKFKYLCLGNNWLGNDLLDWLGNNLLGNVLLDWDLLHYWLLVVLWLDIWSPDWGWLNWISILGILKTVKINILLKVKMCCYKQAMVVDPIRLMVDSCLLCLEEMTFFFVF